MADEHDLQPEDLPEMGRDLRRLYGPAVNVPADEDAAIRAAVRRGFAERRRTRLVVTRRLAPFAAAAAAVLFVIWLAMPRPSSPPPESIAVETEPADFDGNGRVDILDAFHLARRLEAGEEVDSTLDLNRDGAVDARDVDRIALRAVSLTPGAG
ncbi:MAG: dockerin type I domain-containing protein [Planctomycetota bacterium]|nr:dockerin type I domain-containing protein [Planctomycetota bacterium]